MGGSCRLTASDLKMMRVPGVHKSLGFIKNADGIWFPEVLAIEV